MSHAPFEAAAEREPRMALFLDPDVDTNSLYSEFFRMNGWGADSTCDGRDALAKALSARPHVIVTETRLLGFSGLELCRILRRDPATANVPIVVVTSDCSSAAHVEQIQTAGADTILVKPCAPDNLLAEATRLVASPRLIADRATVVSRRRPAAPRSLTLTARHRRGATTTPPRVPPRSRCPACDSTLAYETSEIGGVSAKNPEQWDYFSCPCGCGRFQYRHRTRTVRRAG
jgi:CheY-like chemotaxis protein